MKDVMNGSATLNVVTSGICVSRSGRLSASMISPRKAYETPNAAAIAASEMISRARSSSRCSTSVA